MASLHSGVGKQEGERSRNRLYDCMLVYISGLHRVRGLDSTEDETGLTENTSLSAHAKLKENGAVGTERERRKDAKVYLIGLWPSQRLY